MESQKIHVEMIVDKEQRHLQMLNVYREYAKHQYELMNHRTTWYITIQSLLFASCALAAQSKASMLEKLDTEKVQAALALTNFLTVFSAIICCAGIYTSLIAFLGIRAAGNPINSIKEDWCTKFIAAADPAVAASEMPPSLVGWGNATAHFHGVALAKSIPIGLGLAWIAMLLAHNSRWTSRLLEFTATITG